MDPLEVALFFILTFQKCKTIELISVGFPMISFDVSLNLSGVHRISFGSPLMSEVFPLAFPRFPLIS